MYKKAHISHILISLLLSASAIAGEWTASAIYSAGNTVTYQGKSYKARWWTTGEVPGSSQWGAWQDISTTVTTGTPTLQPASTAKPTAMPVVTAAPTIKPIVTATPGVKPSSTPVVTIKPTLAPSAAPSVTPLVTPNIVAAAIPAKATIQLNVVGNNVTVVWNKWYGESATSWELYEEEKLIKSGNVIPNGLNPQNVTIPVGEKKIGLYRYSVKLINSKGFSLSDTANAMVGDASKILLPALDIDGQALQATLPQGLSSLDLAVLGVSNPQLSALSNAPFIASVSISGNKLLIDAKKAGRVGVRIKDANGAVRFLGLRIKNADGSLPKMPDYVSIGSVSDDTKTAQDTWRNFDLAGKNTRVDARYIYINGGACVSDCWRKWTPEDGGRISTYIRESKKLGQIPYFVWYNIPAGGESYFNDLTNIQTTSYMRAYFADLKFAIELANKEAGDDVVGWILEPDFIGYMMQQSGKQPSEILAFVDQAYEVGLLDRQHDPIFPNTVKGLVEAINYTFNTKANNAFYGWQFNVWGANGFVAKGLMHETDANEKGLTAGRAVIAQKAKEIADYYLAAGVANYGAQFISIDKYGLDGGAPGKNEWFWNADHWNNYNFFTSELNRLTQKPVILWQLPVGHVNGTESINPYTGKAFNPLVGSKASYEDTAPVYYFGDVFTPKSAVLSASHFKENRFNDPKIKVNGDQVTWEGHIEEAKKSGVISIMFGAGVGDSTDSVGLNGIPLTDDHWWLVKAQNYYINGVVPLK